MSAMTSTSTSVARGQEARGTVVSDRTGEEGEIT